MTKLKSFLLAFISIIYIIVLAYFDYMKGPHLAFSFFYIIPIVLFAWFLPKRFIIIPLVLTVIGRFCTDIVSPYKRTQFVFPYWNLFWEMAALVLIIYLVLTVKAKADLIAAQKKRLELDIIESKKAEEKIVALASYPELNPNPICEIDAKGNVLYVNPAAKQLFSDLQISGLNHPWLADIKPKLSTLLQHGKKHFSYEVKIRDRYYYQSVYCVIGSNRLRVYGLDITDRKQIEIALQKNEAWLSVTLSSIGDAVITTDTRGRVTFLNPVAENLTGWRKNDAISKNLAEVFKIINENTGEPVQNPVERVLREHVVVGLANHTVLIAKDGTRYPIDDSAAPIRDKEGDVIGVVLIFRDVSKGRKAQAALENSEASYRAIFELANDAIIIRDINTYQILDANKKACEIFCYPKEEAIGLALQATTTEEPLYNLKKLTLLYDKVARGEGQIFEWPVKDKHGRTFWVEANMRRAVVGGKYCILSIARDITERKQLLEQKDNFMNMVSHELRTPLSSIKESISLVLEGITGPTNEKQQEVLYAGKRNVDRLKRLIDQVLDFQKMTAGQMKFNFEKNDINSAVKEAHMSMISLASKKGLKVNLSLEDDLPRLDFDKDRIIEVLVNLLNNSIKYTEKGSITITTDSADNTIQVSIKDTGCGIKEEDIPKLFQRFSQVGRKPGGSGLGLAISKEIIEAHKGKIWVESEFDKGATFYFTLPIEERRG